MRLVGATNWFIRWPFMVEGLLVCGLLGAGIAIGFLFLGKTVIVDPLKNNFNLINSGDTIGFATLALILLPCGHGRLGDGQRADPPSLPPDLRTCPAGQVLGL